MSVKRKPRTILLGIALILPLLFGCAPRTPSLNSTPALPPAQPAAPTIPPTRPLPATQPVAAPTSIDQGGQVDLFFIAIGDNGASGKLVGCGDSLVAVPQPVANPQQPLTSAYQDLLSLHNQSVGESGLYNALYQSNLALVRAQVVSGVATIELTGDLKLGGECDSPRLQAQLEQPALQFSTVQSVNILINGKPLSELLSLKGEGPTVTPSSGAAFQTAKIYLIAVGDNGASGSLVGCGDSAVPVEVPIPATTDPSEALKSAVEALLSAGDKYAGGAGLYNVFTPSALRVDGAGITNGVASLQLSGNLSLGGECDNPRVTAQLEETIRQFPGINTIGITLNGKPLKDALSLK